MLDDKHIVELFSARSEQAISELADKYGNAAATLINNILNNRSDTEECVNDTYLSVWNSIPPAKPVSLKAYTLSIARNNALTRYHLNTALKRNSFYDMALDELTDTLADKEDVQSVLDGEELQKSINSFLARISKRDRQMFILRYSLAYPVSDIAGMFGLKSRHVSLRLFRIREKLKQYLIKEGYII